MRARATRNKYQDCPAAIAAFGSPESKTHISIGREYEVYALSVFQGVVCLQIINDADIISWKPAWFFEVSDATVPGDWICSLPDDNVQMVLGPPFVAADKDSYIRMVELDSDSVATFWERIDKSTPEE